MSTIYLETSALLVWLLGEPKAAEIRDQIDQADVVTCSALTLIEAERALIRAKCLGHFAAKKISSLRKLLHSTQSAWMVLEISETVGTAAMREFPIEPIRSLDAIHLASAITLIAAFPDIKILSFDERILKNSAALGIPLAHTIPSTVR